MIIRVRLVMDIDALHVRRPGLEKHATEDVQETVKNVISIMDHVLVVNLDIMVQIATRNATDVNSGYVTLIHARSDVKLDFMKKGCRGLKTATHVPNIVNIV